MVPIYLKPIVKTRRAQTSESQDSKLYSSQYKLTSGHSSRSVVGPVRNPRDPDRAPGHWRVVDVVVVGGSTATLRELLGTTAMLRCIAP